jgi:hypothetical protein
MTPEQRALRARMASHTFWADTPDPADRRKHTARARRNSPVSFEYHLARVPEDITDPQARRKAAESAHKAYMTKLAYASQMARAKKKAQQT